jgi:hypothetical protein
MIGRSWQDYAISIVIIATMKRASCFPAGERTPINDEREKWHSTKTAVISRNPHTQTLTRHIHPAKLPLPPESIAARAVAMKLA